MELESLRGRAGPSLIGASVVGWILTRIIVWLPLGFVGTWINGFLWPVIILALIVGVALTVMQTRRN